MVHRPQHAEARMKQRAGGDRPHPAVLSYQGQSLRRTRRSVPPTLQVECGPEAGWHARGFRIVAPITVRARRSGRTAATGPDRLPIACLDSSRRPSHNLRIVRMLSYE
jgi:hypothetical protein